MPVRLSPETLDEIAASGVTVPTYDRDGITALQHARRLGFTEIADILDRASS